MKRCLIFIFFVFFNLQSSNALANMSDLQRIFRAGIIAYNAGQYEKSIKLFEKSIELYPLAQAYNYLGLAQRMSGKPLNELILTFQKAIELDPNLGEAHENLSKIYYGLGNFEKAEEHGLKAIELLPDSHQAKLSLAWVYLLGKSQPADAIPYFEEVINHVSASHVHFGLGMAYILNEQRIEVLSMITELRMSGKDGLAKELERMLRDNSYRPKSIEGSPLFLPKSQPSILVKDFPSISDGVAVSHQEDSGVKVRLRKKPLSRLSQSSDQFFKEKETGEDRIRRLQKNSYSKGSMY